MSVSTRRPWGRAGAGRRPSPPSPAPHRHPPDVRPAPARRPSRRRRRGPTSSAVRPVRSRRPRSTASSTATACCGWPACWVANWSWPTRPPGRSSAASAPSRASAPVPTIWPWPRTAPSTGAGGPPVRSAGWPPGTRSRALANVGGGVNPVVLGADGAVYVSRLFTGMGLYRIDPATGAVRVLSPDVAINAFGFGPDGAIYGPTGLTLPSRLVRVDPSTGRSDAGHPDPRPAGLVGPLPPGGSGRGAHDGLRPDVDRAGGGAAHRRHHRPEGGARHPAPAHAGRQHRLRPRRAHVRHRLHRAGGGRRRDRRADPQGRDRAHVTAAFSRGRREPCGRGLRGGGRRACRSWPAGGWRPSAPTGRGGGRCPGWSGPGRRARRPPAPGA